jgi:hypothetical protein
MRKDTLEHTLSNLATGAYALVVHALFAELVLCVIKPPNFGTCGDTREEEEAAQCDGEANATILSTLADMPAGRKG